MLSQGVGTGIVLLLAGIGAAFPVQAQRSSGARAPTYSFATLDQARSVLGARDAYVRATAALERSAKLKVADSVDEDRFVRHMQSTALEWTDEQRQGLAPLLAVLARFLEGVKWKIPERLLLIQSDAALEDDAAHTRDNAIVMPASYYPRGSGLLLRVLAHETFHVLTRKNVELRERLYSAIGFRRCESVVIPPAIASLRITNPDTVDRRHTISVRHQGKPVDALPYIRFPSADIDPRAGFMKQIQVAWLLVDRRGTECRARGGAQEGGVAPQELEGLSEQVGRNTQYLFDAEEILADNFTLLFLTSVSSSAPGLPSPEILERMRRILFE